MYQENGSDAYQDTKRQMARASDLIDAGRLADADTVLQGSGAIWSDLVLHVGRSRLAIMAAWKRGVAS